eukprot:TRINITY_DN1220_c0_g1_i1.p1 TRINITY_DN1220_c0_g1~~TRINITY_DN1220_c0_g1_i1.p1  ORF type:complete len:456 (+),score=104.13 TRINITY_DN1220_c0_g1_i1:51-1418(+)
MNVLLQPVADLLAVPLDQIRFVFCLIVLFPLCWNFRFMGHRPALKHVYSLVLGSYFIFSLFGAGILHLLFTSTVVYVIMRLWPSSRYAYKFCVFFTIAYMLGCHIDRYIVDPYGWSMDFTGMQMLATIRLSQYAFCVHDANLPKEEREKLTARQKQYMIEVQPSPFQYYSWHFFLPGVVAATYEYRDYIRFVEEKKDIPLRLWPVVRLISVAFMFLGVVTMWGNVVGVKGLAEKVIVNGHKRSFVSNMLLIYAACIVQRARYYFAWLFSEALGNISGIGFTGLDANGKEVWNNSQGVDWMRVEFPSNPRSGNDAWNKFANRWLRFYIFERLPTSPGVARLVTFVMSAIWHGVYPGYYLAFISLCAHVTVANEARAKLRTRVHSLNSRVVTAVYDLVASVLTIMSCGYSMISFMMLSGRQSIGLWRATYFAPHILAAVAYPVLLLLPMPKRADKGQ